ncbi:MAG: hypothetical protein H0W48_07490 [Methylibium sp.]|nr:hypothetical protein [Methylibium sp.]
MRHDIPASQERPAGAAGNTGAQRYAPIARHAVIGDRRTAALVTDDGSIDWWCLPNFDGQPVLAGLLDVDQGGRWRLGPEARIAGAQHYIDHSAVVRTRWSQPASGLELTDCMLWPDRPAGDHLEHRRVIEGAFIPCTFWLVSALAKTGRHDEAERLLKQVEEFYGPLGLFSEQADPRTGAALGNTPLLFSHAEHLKAGMDLAMSAPLEMLHLAAGKVAAGITRLVQ